MTGTPNKRNFYLGVYNGILIAVSDALLNSGLVLAPFLSKLGGVASAALSALSLSPQTL